MTLATEMSEVGTVDARVRLYREFIRLFPEYVLIGIGEGNYWEAWTQNTDLNHGTYVSPPHNAFIEVTVFWGLPALAAFLWLLSHAYRCVPQIQEGNSLSLAVFAVAISVFLNLFVSSEIYGKHHSLALGLLGGCWYWMRSLRRAGA